jgi:hypothetical protein
MSGSAGTCPRRHVGMAHNCFWGCTLITDRQPMALSIAGGILARFTARHGVSGHRPAVYGGSPSNVLCNSAPFYGASSAALALESRWLNPKREGPQTGIKLISAALLPGKMPGLNRGRTVNGPQVLGCGSYWFEKVSAIDPPRLDLAYRNRRPNPQQRGRKLAEESWEYAEKLEVPTGTFLRPRRLIRQRTRSNPNLTRARP